MVEVDALSGEVIDSAIAIHRELGPGLLESVYEMVLAGTLRGKGLKVDRQMPIDIEYAGVRYDAAFRIDLLIEDVLLVEIKSVERLAPVHGKQLLTYLRLARQSVGLLLNFSGATMKEGIKRVVNDYRPSLDPSAFPRLRVNQTNGAT